MQGTARWPVRCWLRSTIGSLLRGSVQSQQVPGCASPPAHKASPQAAQWSAPCWLDRSRPGSVGDPLPSYVAAAWWNCQRFPTGGQSRQKGNGPLRLVFGFFFSLSFSPLTTLFQTTP
ncbi:hypothetical protein J3F84DRAFT_48095 [Trichoderma pleuroticola]